MNERLIPTTKQLFEKLRHSARVQNKHTTQPIDRQRGRFFRLYFALCALWCFPTFAASQWEQLPPLPEPNGGFVCGCKDGKIVVMGGTNWAGGKKNWLKKVHEFDPVQKTWHAGIERTEPVAYAVVFQQDASFVTGGGYDGTKNIDAGRLKHGVLSAGGQVNGRMILAGGTDDPANLTGLSKEVWTLSKGHIRQADYPGKPFATAASAVLGEELFVFGGMNYDAKAKLPVNTGEAYAFSPEKNAWRKLMPLMTPTRGLSAVTLDNNHIYIAGGYREDFTAEAVIYDVKTNRYQKAVSLPYAAMVGLVKLGGHVYCIGGEDKKQSRTDQFFRIPVAALLE